MLFVVKIILGINPSGNVARWNLSNMPDPTYGILKIDNRNNKEIVSYMLSDVTGKVLQLEIITMNWILDNNHLCILYFL